MRKLTTQEFIDKAKKIHGDKYGYSKVEYIKSASKVCIICSKHGEFWQIANVSIPYYLNNNQIKELIINIFKENGFNMCNE